jgi:hypothetical protein
MSACEYHARNLKQQIITNIKTMLINVIINTKVIRISIALLTHIHRNYENVPNVVLAS